jgi:hypothetical protein
LHPVAVERATPAMHPPPPPPPPPGSRSPRKEFTSVGGNGSGVKATPQVPPIPPTPPQPPHHYTQPSSQQSPSSSNPSHPMDSWRTEFQNMFQAIRGGMAWRQLQAASHRMRGAAQKRSQQPEGNESHAAQTLWDALPMVLLWGFCALWPRSVSANSGIKAPAVSDGEALACVTQDCHQTNVAPLTPGDIIVSDAWAFLGPVHSVCLQDPGDRDARQGPFGS